MRGGHSTPGTSPLKLQGKADDKSNKSCHGAAVERCKCDNANQQEPCSSMMMLRNVAHCTIDVPPKKMT